MHGARIKSVLIGTTLLAVLSVATLSQARADAYVGIDADWEASVTGYSMSISGDGLSAIPAGIIISCYGAATSESGRCRFEQSYNYTLQSGELSLNASDVGGIMIANTGGTTSGYIQLYGYASLDFPEIAQVGANPGFASVSAVLFQTDDPATLAYESENCGDEKNLSTTGQGSADFPDQNYCEESISVPQPGQSTYFGFDVGLAETLIAVPEPTSLALLVSSVVGFIGLSKVRPRHRSGRGRGIF